MGQILLVLCIGVVIGYLLSTKKKEPEAPKPWEEQGNNEITLSPPQNQKACVNLIAEHKINGPVYRTNSLLRPLIEKTGNQYKLPSGSANASLLESSAIVVIILYFVEKDPSLGITKLQHYIIMLDTICFQQQKKRLFGYRLLEGCHGLYIRNFREFLDFLQSKGLVQIQKKHYDEERFKYVYTPEYHIESEMIPEPLLTWMHYVLSTWRGVGADQTKAEIESQIPPTALLEFTRIPALN